MFGLRKRDFAELEKRLGYKFRRQELLRQALMHRSYRFENDGVEKDNQRLEFLGDAVLGLMMADYLFKTYRDMDEGKMTSLRSQITSRKGLARIAGELGLGKFILLGKGEEGSGGRKRASSLEDALESVIGATYLDGGMKAVKRLFKTVFVPEVESLSGDVWEHNPKGKLQEYAQQKWKSGPVYHLVRRDGPAHASRCTTKVVLPDGSEGFGEGQSKQASERQAAIQVLGLLDGFSQ